MARYTNVVSCRKTPGELNQTVSSYLTSNGFRQVDAAQNIWKKGMGLLTGPQFVRFEAQPGALRLEGWIQFALLPGVYVGEMGVDGLFAIIPKRMLKAKLMEIERLSQG